MADLKQALIWLAEGKKICISDWPNELKYIHITDGSIKANDGSKRYMNSGDNWELYEEPKPIPPPQYDPREVQLDNPLRDMEDYIVWDKSGRNMIATWSKKDKCFFSRDYYGFALEVFEWKPLPKRDEK